MKILLLLVGFFILTFTLAFFVVSNNVSAEVEMKKYTNTDAFNVTFDYPSHWVVTEKISRFDGNSIVAKDSWETNQNMSLPHERAFTIQIQYAPDIFSTDLLDATNKYIKIIQESALVKGYFLYTVIEEPSITSVDGKKASRYLMTSETKPGTGLMNPKAGIETWIVPAGKQAYLIQFQDTIDFYDINYFDLPEITKIRNQIIDSLHFLN